jgi:hypothetical protein
MLERGKLSLMENPWLIWRKAFVVVAIATLPAYLAIMWGLKSQQAQSTTDEETPTQIETTIAP